MVQTIALDAKQDSVAVITQTRSIVSPGSAARVPCPNSNAVLVDVICEGGWTGTVEIYGSNGGALMQEPDPNATKAVSGAVRYVVLNVSQAVTAGISAVSGSGNGGISVVLTPFIAAAAATVAVTGTSYTDLAQYGGSNVGPGNPLDVKPGTGAVFPVSAAQLPGTLGAKVSATSLSVAPATDATFPVDSELPAALSLADGAANPTTPTVGTAKLGFNGATWDRERIATVFKNIAAQAVTAGTPVIVWTPTTGKKFRVLGYALSLTVAGSVILKDSTTEILRTPLMGAGIGLVSPVMGNGILSAAVNNALEIDVSATGSVSGYVYGTEE